MSFGIPHGDPFGKYLLVNSLGTLVWKTLLRIPLGKRSWKSILDISLRKLSWKLSWNSLLVSWKSITKHSLGKLALEIPLAKLSWKNLSENSSSLADSQIWSPPGWKIKDKRPKVEFVLPKWRYRHRAHELIHETTRFRGYGWVLARTLSTQPSKM